MTKVFVTPVDQVYKPWPKLFIFMRFLSKRLPLCSWNGMLKHFSKDISNKLLLQAVHKRANPIEKFFRLQLTTPLKSLHKASLLDGKVSTFDPFFLAAHDQSSRNISCIYFDKLPEGWPIYIHPSPTFDLSYFSSHFYWRNKKKYENNADWSITKIYHSRRANRGKGKRNVKKDNSDQFSPSTWFQPRGEWARVVDRNQSIVLLP